MRQNTKAATLAPGDGYVVVGDFAKRASVASVEPTDIPIPGGEGGCRQPETDVFAASDFAKRASKASAKAAVIFVSWCDGDVLLARK